MSTALFLHGPHDARVAPFNLREGRPGEVLLRVGAVGLCGSDMHYYKDGGIGAARITSPFVPGHEFGGWLESDVAEMGLQAGALVAVDPNGACGHCAQCHAGHPNLCPNVEFIGAPPFDGAMTGRLWVPRKQVVPLPDGFTPLDAVMLEPLGVAVHAVDLAKPRLLETAVVLGCGPIGLLVLQVLKAGGAGDILAIDPQPRRQQMALALGAAKAGASVSEVAGWTGGGGAPLVVEATNSPDGFRDAVRAASIGGRLVLVGIPDGDTYAMPASEARRRALGIKFSRRMGEVYLRAIKLVDSGKVDVVSMVTHRPNLEGGPAAFAAHAANEPDRVKTIIYPGS